VITRPFRSPHHSASHVAVVGGGNAIRPGEVSLAHRGVLLFDEMPEFARITIESLRQPLEDRTITVSRVKESSEFPANFIFVATANPCPCGYYGVPRGRARTRRCQCSPYAVQHYRRKLSGPLLDRIDICVNVDHIEHDKLLEPTENSGSTEATKQRIAEVRALQRQRFSEQKLNSDMTNRDIKQFSRLSPDAKAILIDAGSKLELSARAYMRSLKVARTIADLAGSPTIEPHHITEALQFRTASLYGS
jgi:magnesium chelatase family protein